MDYLTLSWPTRRNAPITQRFGENPQIYSEIRVGGARLRGHNGLDIGISFEPVLAPMDGIVAEADDQGRSVPGYGKYIKIVDASAHGSTPGEWRATSRYHTVLAHLSRIDVKVGQRVKAGQHVGISGNTGWSTGPHLHLGLRIKPYNRADGWGGYVNPLPHLIHAEAQKGAVIGPYWIPHHRDIKDLPVMHRWRPAVIKLEAAGWESPELVADLISKTDAILFLRDYAWTGEPRHQELFSDPAGFGKRHAAAAIEKIERVRKAVQERGIDMPPERFVVMATNEPPIWQPGWSDALVEYSLSFAEALTQHGGWYAGLGNFNVGWPGNHCHGCAPDWSFFTRVIAYARATGHIISNHEYWADGGPNAWLRWWVGRGESMPDEQVRRIVGEAGFEKRVKDNSVDAHHAGWSAHVSEDEYIQHLQDYAHIAGGDSRLIGATVFLYDYDNKIWESFDIRRLRGKLISALQAIPRRFRTPFFHDDDGNNQPPPPSEEPCRELYDKIEKARADIARVIQTLQQIEGGLS